MENHSFSVEMAILLTQEGATLLQHHYFWHKRNKANNKNFIDGYYWTYNSASAFSEVFPYLSEKQIRSLHENFIACGFMVKGNYNKNKCDRSQWFALTDFGISIFENWNLPKVYSMLQKVKWICQNVKSKSKKVKSIYLEVTPIPDIKPNVNTDVISDKEVSVVTDTPPLATNLSSAEIPTGSESLESRANNLKGTIIENHFYESENLVSLKEKSRTEKVNSGGGGENSQSDVGKLDIDAKISPLGMSAEKLDFIFLEASRIDTTEIRAKFIDWHVRRAKETNGVRTCAIYAKKMRLMANSDLEVWEVIKGLEIAYEAAWIDIQPDWIKKRTRQNDKQNGTTKLQQQKQYIADSPLFKGI